VITLQGALQDALAQHPAIDCVGAGSHRPFDNLPNWSTQAASRGSRRLGKV
jgi:hypothetical protein